MSAGDQQASAGSADRSWPTANPGRRCARCDGFRREALRRRRLRRLPRGSGRSRRQPACPPARLRRVARRRRWLQISARSEESNSVDAGLLFDDRRAVEPEPALRVMTSRVHSPAAMLIPPNEPTAPATTPITGAQPPQIQDGRTDLGDGVEPEVGLLQSDATGLEQAAPRRSVCPRRCRRPPARSAWRSWRPRPRPCRRPESPAR